MVKTIEYFDVVDKSEWPRGPWAREPDKKQWADPKTGLPCLIVRGPSGALCGYVGVPPMHPYHMVPYDDVPANVHGGLTFASLCGHREDPSQGVCHIPEPEESDDVWWLGFDCAHYNDYSPGFPNFSGEVRRAPYRDLVYVEEQVTDLASQFASATK